MNQPSSDQVRAWAASYLQGTITPEDKERLLEWYRQMPDGPLLWDEEGVEDAAALEASLLAGIKEGAGLAAPARVWPRYAAAACIIALLGIGVYWLTKESANPQQTAVAAAPKDINPGHDGALLTLADGTITVLDSTGTAELPQQGDTKLERHAGELRYVALESSSSANGSSTTRTTGTGTSATGSSATGTSATGSSTTRTTGTGSSANGSSANRGASTSPANRAGSSAPAYNTLTTPRGRQFRLILSDGSKVWLNAASSLQYPTTFTGSERLVEVTGEAYFEVAKNTQHPFRVKMRDGVTVEVLGTNFNVNAYDDEPDIRTTLLTGAVMVETPHHTKTLSPGQQARVGSSTMTVAQADVRNCIAWKDHAFGFNDASVPEVMRQLARWYNVDVMYQGNVPAGHFTGEIGRDLTLIQTLKLLAGARIHFRLENGKKLIIMP